jgi:hypothetical protein
VWVERGANASALICLRLPMTTPEFSGLQLKE